MSAALLDDLGQRLSAIALPPPGVCGVLTRVTGMLLGARGVRAPLGSYCEVMAEQGEGITCEVVGFSGEEVMLMPLATVQGLLPGTGVRVVTQTARVGVGDALLGRVVDGLGRPLDGGEDIEPSSFVALRGERKNPLRRAPIDGVLDVGVRAINSFLTIGRGQRIGLIAGSGVGKSVLLGMMTRFTAADVVVIRMIGERVSEVLDFVTETLGEEGRRRAVVVAAPGDCSPVVRLRATHYTCAIAEHFRDQGKNVLLLMDSLTRVAHAQREVGLAVGEPPTTKGYTPSVFSLINELVERAGSDASGGSITGIYTILAEGDDANDPIVDGARAILDGHVLLSRELAAMGQYPAIDINFSVSRLANRLVSPEQRAWVRKFRRLMATWEENRDLVSVGAYRAGANPDLDEALQRRPALQAFLQQDVDERVEYDEGFRQLAEALA
ncbi:MAG: FliI/YscN family ATPase [Alphaproteobacteria bacterium]